MMKYLFHFTSGRQGRFRGLRADLRIALMDSIICLGTLRGGWLDVFRQIDVEGQKGLARSVGGAGFDGMRHQVDELTA